MEPISVFDALKRGVCLSCPSYDPDIRPPFTTHCRSTRIVEYVKTPEGEARACGRKSIDPPKKAHAAELSLTDRFMKKGGE